ncbi:hypothetical protein ACF1BQ_030325 [Bradyrhizobium sp. RDT10]
MLDAGDDIHFDIGSLGRGWRTLQLVSPQNAAFDPADNHPSGFSMPSMSSPRHVESARRTAILADRGSWQINDGSSAGL